MPQRKPLLILKATNTERYQIKDAIERVLRYCNAQRQLGTATFRNELHVAVRHANTAMQKIEQRRLKAIKK